MLHTAKIISIPIPQRTDMARQNIITPEAVWEERRTREDSWLHSADWLIRVIKQMRKEADYPVVIIIGEFICLMVFVNYLMMCYYIYIDPSCQHLISNLKQCILHHCEGSCKSLCRE